jgi:peptidoglycan/LPS O-acetylase OafA/YrhL
VVRLAIYVATEVGLQDASTSVRRLKGEAPRVDSLRQLDSLLGLRFVAAFFVVGFHFLYYLGQPAQRDLLPIFGRGGSAVGLFFLLSGVVLAWSSRDHDRALRVWRRRLARIYPAYVVAWLVVGAALSFLHYPLSTQAGVYNLLLVQSWIPHYTVYWGWNGVGWSLSCEAFFYLLLPLILVLLRHRSARVLAAVAVLSASLTITASVLATQWTPSGTPLNSTFNRFGWLVYVCPLGRLPEFVLGCVLGLMLKKGCLPRLHVIPVVALVVAAYIRAYSLHHLAAQTGLMVIPFALLVVALAQADLYRSRARLLSSRPLQHLGACSYAFYLLQGAVLALVEHYTPPISGTFAAVIALLEVTALLAVAAYIVYRLVESPVNRWAGSNRVRPSRAPVMIPRMRPPVPSA